MPKGIYLRTEQHKTNMSIAHLGKKLSKETRQKMRMAKLGNKNSNFGKPLSAEHRKNISLAHKKNGVMPPYRIGFRHTEESKKQMSESRKGKKHPLFGKHLPLSYRKKISEALKGNKSSFWKGGITPVNQKIRVSSKYKLWRKLIFERDDFRCFDCGEKNKRLEADHIYPFALYPRLRFDINNGQTVCKDCHKERTKRMLKIYWIQLYRN